MREQAKASWLDAPCPPWCQRDHHPDDHPEDRRHQGPGTAVRLEVATDAPARSETQVVETIAYADRPIDSATTWIRLEALESSDIRIVVTAESARALLGALATVIQSLDSSP